mgnify:CR=1 FL=1
MMEVDTSQILFICGGAFDGMERIVRHRTEKSEIGFNGTVVGKSDSDLTRLFSQIEPADLVKYGLSPNSSAACLSSRFLRSLTKRR